MKEPSMEEKLSTWFYNIVYSRLGADRKALIDAMARDIAAQQGVHLTALRRWLATSFFINILLLLLAIIFIGGR